ncbi:hypothetical protein [Janthinobacterium sp.]|uniref:hypothetical protein n=1 Tax=Janthinobacterium sp. TaxID=1871054 RepID=UPI002583C2F2|nr:hypothetical protein [Janthinobacterium sp.]MCX7293884.1 hypothetical protein [Janthinobacterium sp.]
MHPFNTAKKIKSTEKVVIFIEAIVARWAAPGVLSYEKRRKLTAGGVVVFCENVFRCGEMQAGVALRRRSGAWLASGLWLRRGAGVVLPAWAWRCRLGRCGVGLRPAG